MSIELQLIDIENLILEIIFLDFEVENYSIISNPPVNEFYKMEELENKHFANRDYRFIAINQKTWKSLVEKKCDLYVVAEDMNGATQYSETIQPYKL